MDRYLDEEYIIDNLEEYDLEAVSIGLNEYKSKYGKTEFYYLALSDYLILIEYYEKVIDTLDDAVNDGYISSEIYERYADAYFSLNQYERAIEYLEKVDLTSDDPDYFRLFTLGGMCNYRLGRYKEALRYYEDMLMEDTTNPVGYCFAGFCYLRLGDFSTAEKYLKYIIQSEDSVWVYNVFQELSDLDNKDIIEKMGEYVQEQYKHFSFLSMGYFYLNHEDFENAIKYFKLYLRYEDNLGVTIELAKLYHHTNDEKRCQDILHDLYENLPDFEDVDYYEENIPLLLNMMEYINLDRNNKMQIIKDWVDYLPYNPVNIEYIFEFAVQFKLYDFVEEIMQTDSLIFEGNIHLQYLRIVYYMDKENYKKAIGYLLLMDHQEKETLYQKYLVMNLFFLGIYNKVIELGKPLLPDGRIAMMMIGAYRELNQNLEADNLIDYMLEHLDEEYEDRDIFLDFLRELRNQYEA